MEIKKRGVVAALFDCCDSFLGSVIVVGSIILCIYFIVWMVTHLLEWGAI